MKQPVEQFSRAWLEQLLSEDQQGLSVCHQTTDVIEMGGRKFVPDETKGYIDLRMSHSFPTFNAYGQGIHPHVISQSYKSLEHQNVNYEHHLVAYDKEKNTHDKILGTVLAVEFPRPLGTTWRVPKTAEEAPAIRAVASFTKLARGVDTIMGKHLSGRHTFTVSMEVRYNYKDCAFAVALNGKKPKHDTPDDIAEAGYEYIPWVDSEDDLLKCYSPTRNRITSDWQGRKVVQLLGGLDKPVHYSGLAIVQFGAERTAEILQMAASNTEDVVKQVMAPLHDLATLFDRIG
jgi:hypothetical protein